MKSAFKHIVARTYKPLLVKYLSKTRIYRYDDIKLEVPPQVFHPGFFFSTRVLMDYIIQLPLQDTNFLELGCGSGLISIYAAKKRASVTATDINPIAIEYLQKNSLVNKANITVIQSDLFKDIPEQAFDIIAINPPYYKKQPINPADYAWYCGENGEYFETLFSGLKKYIHQQTEVLMVLFDGCDIDMIQNMAAKNGFSLHCVHTHKNLLEKNFIYKIQQTR